MNQAREIEFPYPIDEDVPLPPRRGRVADTQKADYQRFLDSIPVGGSRFHPGIRAAKSIPAVASESIRFHRGARFRMRVFDLDPKYNAPGIRVWREK